MIPEARHRVASGLTMDRNVEPPLPSEEIIVAFGLVQKRRFGELTSAISQAVPTDESNRLRVLMFAGEVAGQAARYLNKRKLN